MTLECGTIRQRGHESDFGLEDEYDESTLDEAQCPQQRNAANARERARMRVLSKAFCRLKTTLPWVPPDTKLSKLDTLRLATGYIAHLRAILKLSENEAPDPTMQPLSMSWPFNFHMHWDSHASSKPTVIDTNPKNEWNACAQYLTKKAYHEEDDFRRVKDCHEFDGEKEASQSRHSRNRRRNGLSPCEQTHTAGYGYDEPETVCFKPYKSHAYYNQV